MTLVYVSCGLILAIVGGCSRGGSLAEERAHEALLARAAQVHEVRVNDTEEWKRILRTIRSAQKYYAVERSWGNAVSGGQDRLMALELAGAVQHVRSLVNCGLLAPPEADLLVLDIERETWSRYHSSRNVIDDVSGSEVHIDGIHYPPDWDAWNSLRKRLPHLRELASLRGRDCVIIDRVLQTAERNVVLLRTCETPFDREDAREAAGMMRAIRSHLSTEPLAPPEPPSAGR